MMTGGGPAGATATLSYYLYNNVYQWFKMGYASSIAFLMTIFLLILGIIFYRLIQKRDLKISLLPKEMEDREKTRKRPSIFLIIITIFTILLAVIPFLWALSTSLKEPGAIFTYPPRLFFWPLHFENYIKAWKAVPYSNFFLNSFIQTSVVVIIGVTVAFLAGYSLSLLNPPGKKLIFFLIVITLFISLPIRHIPLFIATRRFNLVDTHFSYIFPYLAFGWGIFIFKIFFDGLKPKVEKFRKEGLSEGNIFWKKVLPISRPIIGIAAAMLAFSTWQQFGIPLVTINTMAKKTLPIGLASFQGLYTTDWSLLMAGGIMSALPSIIIFLIIIILLEKFVFRRLVISQKN